MNEWVRLIDEKPSKEEFYRVLKFSEWGTRWKEVYLRWDKEHEFNFQGKGQGGEIYPIYEEVTHWLKTEIPEVPIEDAESLIIETEVFFWHPSLDIFARKNQIKSFARYGNATEYIITDVPIQIISEMESIFKGQMKHKHIKKS